MENAPQPVEYDFKIGDIVLAYHGSLLYEAVIRKVNLHPTTQHVLAYIVHYQGWKKSWDAPVPRHHVYEHNEDNLRHAHQLLQGAKLRQQAIRPVEQDGGESNRSEEESDSDSKQDGEASSSDTLFHLPQALKRQLVDDWEFVTKENRLVDLPRSITVQEIMDKWVQTQRNPEDAACREVADGVHRYFNAALPTMLLYKFERPQYNDKFHGPNAVTSDVLPSQVYGAEHLLRLLLKLPFMLQSAGVEPDMMKRIADKVNNLCSYMRKNGRLLFLPEYEAATAEYIDAHARQMAPNTQGSV